LLPLQLCCYTARSRRMGTPTTLSDFILTSSSPLFSTVINPSPSRKFLCCQTTFQKNTNHQIGHSSAYASSTPQITSSTHAVNLTTCFASSLQPLLNPSLQIQRRLLPHLGMTERTQYRSPLNSSCQSVP
jgi:hypothetical protein